MFNKINLIKNKYINMSKPAKASIWYTICNIFQRAISFFIIPIYTHYLSTAEYGQYTVFQSWREIIMIFATLNLYCGQFTKAMVDIEDERDEYTSSMQGLTTCCTLILGIIFYLFHSEITRVLDMGNITLLLLFAYYIFNPAFLFWSVRQRVEYKYVLMIVLTLIMSILTPVISLIMLFNSSLRTDAVIWGYLIIQIVFGLYFYIYNFLKGKIFFHKQYWIDALKYNIPLIPHYLSLLVLSQADRIMIKYYCGEDKAGIYSLAYTVSQLMLIFITAINNSFVPWEYQKLKIKDYKEIKKSANKLCLLVGFMTFGFCMISPEIVFFLGTKEYNQAVFIIPIVSLSVYISYCYTLYSNIEFYFSATKFVMIASVFGALFNIVLNFIFIPRYGFVAAAYTTLVSYFILMLLHFIFMKIICKNKKIETNIYDNYFISGSIISLIILMIFCIILYKNVIIRYSVISILVLFSILKLKNIIELIKKLK